MTKTLFFIILCLVFLSSLIGFSEAAPLEKRSQSLLKDNTNLLNELMMEKKNSSQLKNKLAAGYKENEELKKSIGALRQANDDYKASLNKLKEANGSLENKVQSLTRSKQQDSQLRKVEKKTKSSFLAEKSARYRLAFIYAKENQPERAIDEFKRVLAIEPQDKDSHFNLGYLYALKQDYANAVREYEKVLNLDPADKQAHYNLAIIYHDTLKNDDLAKEHYENFLQYQGN
jgi:tetratricopeptide (TPR) repeat protein